MQSQYLYNIDVSLEILPQYWFYRLPISKIFLVNISKMSTPNSKVIFHANEYNIGPILGQDIANIGLQLKKLGTKI